MSNVTNVQSNISLLKPQYGETTKGVNDLPDKARVAVLAAQVKYAKLNEGFILIFTDIVPYVLSSLDFRSQPSSAAFVGDGLMKNLP